MFSELAWEKIGRSLRLSERKLQVVRAVFDDRTELSIAATLDISANTVHTPMERMYRKLAVRDRGQLILRVVNEFLTLTAAPGGQPAVHLRPPNGRPLFLAAPLIPV